MKKHVGDYRALSVAAALLRRYFRLRLAHDAAALTYYLLFSLFPLSIFFTNLVGIFAVDVATVLRSLTGLIPREVLALLVYYVEYVSGVSSASLLVFSLVFSVWFPTRAAGALVYSVRRIYGLGPPKNALRYQLRLFVFTFFLILSILLSLALTTLGNTVLGYLFSHLPRGELVLSLWGRARFLLLAVLAFAVMTVLYGMALDRPTFRGIWPGVLLTMGGWLALSLLFSLYVENVGRFSLIYGSIGAIIVLLLWLYLTASILLVGAQFNQILSEAHRI